MTNILCLQIYETNCDANNISGVQSQSIFYAFVQFTQSDYFMVKQHIHNVSLALG